MIKEVVTIGYTRDGKGCRITTRLLDAGNWSPMYATTAQQVQLHDGKVTRFEKSLAPARYNERFEDALEWHISMVHDYGVHITNSLTELTYDMYKTDNDTYKRIKNINEGGVPVES